LHMASRHANIIGENPLGTFVPAKSALRLELERELRGLLIHLRRSFVYAVANPKHFTRFFHTGIAQAMPLLYGAVWLLTEKYPTSHAEALILLQDAVPRDRSLEILLQGDLPSSENEATTLANNYILNLQTLVQAIDQLEIKA